ncbi:MAG: carboxypeptidase-like regulatory domain-containing protein [Actinomycetota bacterium]|jgi:hypothetical protein|nr:carboxypeptidase-like regulatory domain-containing protein [Actinomycetota bacterium]
MNAKTLVAAAAGALSLMAGIATAEAGPPGKWTQVTGTGAPETNTERVGLARTDDGVLHVLWSRDDVGTGSVLHSSISADAKSVSAPSTVFDNPLGGVTSSVDLVRAPDNTLRAFFAATNQYDGLLASATSSDGAGWSVQAPVSKLEPEGKPVYVAGGISAAVANDGTFFSAWGASAPEGDGFHVGLDPTVADGELPGPLNIDPDIGVDSQSGQVVAAWNSLDDELVHVMPLAPAGPATTIPTSAPQTQHRAGVTGRIGAPGVFAAYTKGTNQFLADPSVFRVDTGKALRITKKDGEQIGIAAAPDGRLWVFWKKASNVYATRSNKAATKFGRVVALRTPGSSTTVYNLAGEASRGPLDLLALLEPGSGAIANWHQRILPGLTFSTAKIKKGKQKGKTKVKVTDAEQAVSGAKVKVKGTGSKTTGSSGTVRFGLAKGKYKVTTSKSGYTSFTKRVRVK